MSVSRVFVEKRKGFDVEAANIAEDLRENLRLPAISDVRLILRYDIEGLSDDEFKSAVKNVLSESTADITYDVMPETGNNRYFITEYLPGQYDQRADSASQCIALLTLKQQPTVKCAKMYIIDGTLSDTEFDKVRSYVMNPLESRLAVNDLPSTLQMNVNVPKEVKTVNGFCEYDSKAINSYHDAMGFAMSNEDLEFCRQYFNDTEHRDPTVTELRVIDTYWSDHCRHTTFLTKLNEVEIEPGPLASGIEDAFLDYKLARNDLYTSKGKSKDMCLMDLGTIGTKIVKSRGKLKDLDESEEINACSINAKIDVDGTDKDYLIQFKNETHNHPTEIEPFGGAATCLGGAIRDPLSGRAYVYQAMRVTGAADPRTGLDNTLPGKLSQKKITTGAASGYSSYGNQIGLATGQVHEIYDDGYMAKRMEIGAVVGASPKENVIRLEPEKDDIIVLLGGRTGRDGCGGATGSSKAHNTESIETCGAEVQKGNPPTERKLQRLFRNPDCAKLIKRCNDFGAGGVSVAIGELAPGLVINLDVVPKKYEGLDGTELAISESQERMAVVLSPSDVDRFLKYANDENLEATIVAKVTDTNRLEMDWNGKKIVNISRDFLDTNGVTQTADAYISSVDDKNDYRERVPEILSGKTGIDALKTDLQRLEVCAQKGLAERFDASIGASTVIMPYAGKYQLTPVDGMCAKVPVGDAYTDSATAFTFGFVPGISKWSPFHGAAFSVTMSLAKLAALGADPSKARLTFQEYFERLGSEPKRWGMPLSALLGALYAQTHFNTPAIGGKDSMSGSFNELDVPPTLVSFALSMTKASKTVSNEFKKPGSSVYLVKLPIDKSTHLPDCDKSSELFDIVYKGINSKDILSAGVLTDGGSAAQCLKMAFGNKFGFDFSDELNEKLLFAPLSGSFVVETESKELFKDFEIIKLGNTNSNGKVSVNSETADIDDLIECWLSPLNGIFPTYSSKTAKMTENIELYTERCHKVPAIKAAKPRVLIPTFPGTNCEYDSAKAFDNAGADSHIVVIRNLTPECVEESIKALVEEIKQSQIIMLPGGFSGGDEPDGSGKFIATVLKSPAVKDAVTELLNNRDGLMLGICNGFQALIKTGLVPYGEIRDQKPDDPTLTFNYIGRHISSMVYTRITSVKSPWFSSVNAGDMFTVPISHGEGRFTAGSEIMKSMIENGQIATQYTDCNGVPSSDSKYNLNGSLCAVEGITSPDGRILGKMGHSERFGKDLYKNVPGNKDMKIFESGVKYFK